ncbi:type II toxin-antitoxin system RelE/ParE family toxin [Dyadobacter sp. LJ53]|uniref:type II toxin-antitoxin system RelE/ParE family toxin n=1 Tax=Dyadobacter chenwenxiniae TaxID=2906456 RepID=UPI001F2A3B5B|nr:type II toxin-antitoxin system RelE/ParE family toxin [Dyadobacter chenwenxiniae]MCF0052345.1 type II toxin-antitoxin system RelE/ParE family toxin [Dyadobacter chenwenxiniae]
MAGIIWSKEARQDLDTIFLWLENESKSYSTKWINEVFKKLDLVGKFPNMGRKLPEIKVASIREIPVGKYRIIYNVARENTIEVLAIRHSAKPLSEF